jgi:haloalkane dehalogenase
MMTAPEFHEHRIQLDDKISLYARDYPGSEPAIVLMHGFPDNLHLYDWLVPHLAASGRRIITFDFLGWGRSDKPVDHVYTHGGLARDLDAVIRYFALNGAVLVAHDASGPAAIDWALDYPETVAGLVLLNTYYHAMPSLRAPDAIFGFSRPFGIGKLFQSLMEQRGRFRRLYWYQVGQFMRDSSAREHFLPLLHQQMEGPLTQSTRKAFYDLNNDLVMTNLSRLGRIQGLRQFNRPVRIIFGEGDEYLNAGVAKVFHRLFPRSELFLLPGGRHFVQIDEPAQVAQLILQMQPETTKPPGKSRLSSTAPTLIHRLLYAVFGMNHILFAPIVLWDRWQLYRRVQRIVRSDHAREQGLSG